jgi:hypothetical protein
MSTPAAVRIFGAARPPGSERRLAIALHRTGHRSRNLKERALALHDSLSDCDR